MKKGTTYRLPGTISSVPPNSSEVFSEKHFFLGFQVLNLLHPHDQCICS